MHLLTITLCQRHLYIELRHINNLQRSILYITDIILLLLDNKTNDTVRILRLSYDKGTVGHVANLIREKNFRVKTSRLSGLAFLVSCIITVIDYTMLCILCIQDNILVVCLGLEKHQDDIFRKRKKNKKHQVTYRKHNMRSVLSIFKADEIWRAEDQRFLQIELV